MPSDQGVDRERYSDVQHTVRPVTSGHRLVLTYNLVHVASSPPIMPSSFENDQAKLSASLKIWNERMELKYVDSPGFLAYVLDHKYTEANLQMNHLKGRDAFQAVRLQAACQDQDFCFFLGNLEHKKDGSCEESYDPYDRFGRRGGWNDDYSLPSDGTKEAGSDSGLADYHELGEIFDTSLYLRTLHRTNGQQLAAQIEIKEADIIQRKPFDRAPDKESYEGYTGNAGASATHFYRNSCIIMMPRQYQTSFFLERAKEGNVDMEAWVGTAIEEVAAMPEDNRTILELIDTCELILQNCESMRKKDRAWGVMQGQHVGSNQGTPALNVVIKAALRLMKPSLFESAVVAAEGGLPLGIYGAVGKTLGGVEIGPWEHG